MFFFRLHSGGVLPQPALRLGLGSGLGSGFVEEAGRWALASTEVGQARRGTMSQIIRGTRNARRPE
jgi:hypothetical protein